MTTKCCDHCLHALPPSAFDPSAVSPDGRTDTCTSCLTRFPRLRKRPCGTCGARRDLSRFPGGGDVCEACTKPSTDVAAMLEGADLQDGRPKTAADLLTDMGLDNFTRSESIAAGRWLLAHGFEYTRRGSSRLFYVAPKGANETPGLSALKAATTLPVGTHSVRGLAGILGVENPTKFDQDACARWLLSRGYKTHRIGASRVFVIDGTDGTFNAWAKAYPHAVDHLQLASDERRQLERGAAPDRRTRLAMSALIAGLPPYEG